MGSTGLLICVLIAINFVDGQLTWSKSYTLKAVLTVPDANVSEPYQVWVDRESGKSRIDFYGGMDKLYREWDDLAERYFYYKINPETTTQYINKDVCHIVSDFPETKSYVRNTYLPVKNFKFTSQDNINGVKAEKWQTVVRSSKSNIIEINTVWVHFKKMESADKIPIPLRYVYELKTGNNLIDYFCHDYLHYEPGKPSQDVVQKPLGLACVPLQATPYQAVDPLLEYVEPTIGHYRATNAFHRFKDFHNKTYEEAEHDMRMHIFKNNLRFIESENRQHKSYKLGVTHFADLSKEEIISLFMSTYHNVDDSKVIVVDDDDNNDDDIQVDDDMLRGDKNKLNFDWREYGAVTQVKDQTTLCGSCYAFTSAAVVESSSYIARGCQDIEEISEQAILDCTWGPLGNLGCGGGSDEYTLAWMKENGIPTKDEYGLYLALEGKCHLMNMTKMVNIHNFKKLPKKKILLKEALRENGPLVASLDTSPRSFALFTGGVYDDPVCRSEPYKRTHAVTIVGYGKEGDQDYWLLKNSFGTGWGEEGYMKIATKDNRCGVKNFVYTLEFKKNNAGKCTNI